MLHNKHRNGALIISIMILITGIPLICIGSLTLTRSYIPDYYIRPV